MAQAAEAQQAQQGLTLEESPAAKPCDWACSLPSMPQLRVRLLSGETLEIAYEEDATVLFLKQALEAQRSSLRRCRLNLRVGDPSRRSCRRNSLPAVATRRAPPSPGSPLAVRHILMRVLYVFHIAGLIPWR